MHRTVCHAYTTPADPNHTEILTHGTAESFYCTKMPRADSPSQELL